jgi:hypothetical protein
LYVTPSSLNRDARAPAADAGRASEIVASGNLLDRLLRYTVALIGRGSYGPPSAPTLAG